MQALRSLQGCQHWQWTVSCSTSSDSRTGSRPGMFSFEGRAKYDAWTRIATEYDSETARERYVEIARSAGWKGDVGAGEDEDNAPKPKAKASGFGPTMSLPVQKEYVSYCIR